MVEFCIYMNVPYQSTSTFKANVREEQAGETTAAVGAACGVLCDHLHGLGQVWEPS